jgi:probable HAF family extracellular repeat protein
MAGDLAEHPFLYDGHKMIDLGTFGGTFGVALGGNNSEEAVVVWANLPGDTIHHAFLWRNGAKVDLGVLNGDKCSSGWSINSRGLVVGSSGVCDDYGVHAVLWENGRITDLTTLAPPGIELTYALNINDLGEIACVGRVPNTSGPQLGVQHVFLLIPAGLEGAAATVSSRQDKPALSRPAGPEAGPLVKRLNHGHTIPVPERVH